MKDPKLSVIIPLYNAEATLDYTLRSVRASSEKSLQIICVNDGSTDNSAQVLQTHASEDARVKVITQTNAGVSAARNIALRASEGKYVIFVDADDEVTPTYFSNLLSVAEQHQADLVVGGYCNLVPGKEIKKTVLEAKIYENPTEEELMTLPVGISSHLYRTSTICANGEIAQFPAGVRFGEDTVFHYAAYPYLQKIATTPECGYLIHSTPGSASTKSLSTVTDMIMATDWLGKRFNQIGRTSLHDTLFVQYALHTIRRVRSKAPYAAQKDAANKMRSILQQYGITANSFASLRKKDATLLKRLLSGKNWMTFTYHIKHWLRTLKRRS